MCQEGWIHFKRSLEKKSDEKRFDNWNPKFCAYYFILVFYQLSQTFSGQAALQLVKEPVSKPGSPDPCWKQLCSASSGRHSQGQNNSITWGTACPGIGKILRAQLKKLEVELWLRFSIFQSLWISFHSSRQNVIFKKLSCNARFLGVFAWKITNQNTNARNFSCLIQY